MTTKPNILLILNDDMGYSDLGCYGGEVHTPHLDSLVCRRSALYTILQHRPLLAFPGLISYRTLSPSGGYRSYDGK